MAVKRVDRYLLTRFLAATATGLFGFTAIFLVVDLVEKADRLMDLEVPIASTARYFLLATPGHIAVALPVALLLASAFSLGTLGKRNEIAAMKACGIPLTRIARPILILALCLGPLAFLLDNYAVSPANRQKRDLERSLGTQFSPTRFKERRRDIFLQRGDSLHIFIEQFVPSHRRAVGVGVQYLRGGNLVKRVDGEWMTWQTEEGKWLLHRYSVREFDAAGTEAATLAATGDSLLALPLTPNQLVDEALSPEERNFADLRSFIRDLRETGVDTTRWEVNLHQRIAFAFANLVIVLFSVPLVLMRDRSGVAFGAGSSVFVIFIFYAAVRLGQVLGYNGLLDPAVAAWLGNTVFGGAGLALLLRLRS